MFETKDRNGVLIYIAVDSHVFAIIGDKGINGVVPPDFWNDESELLASYLRDGKPGDGLCKVIEVIGDNLAKFFPWYEGDINEQSNEISYGE